MFTDMSVWNLFIIIFQQLESLKTFYSTHQISSFPFHMLWWHALVTNSYTQCRGFPMGFNNYYSLTRILAKLRTFPSPYEHTQVPPMEHTAVQTNFVLNGKTSCSCLLALCWAWKSVLILTCCIYIIDILRKESIHKAEMGSFFKSCRASHWIFVVSYLLKGLSVLRLHLIYPRKLGKCFNPHLFCGVGRGHSHKSAIWLH